MIARTGREVSRVEGFSDAVFGFALTLLVVSLEVPQTFEDLRAVLSGFVPFGLMFALICWIWYEHYAFFRRFDAEDPLTIALNSVLLFIVLFFVYPLKFVFNNAVKVMSGERAAFFDMSWSDNRLLMSVYSGGFIGIMLIFVLLYWNVYRRRKVLELTPEEIFDARAGARTHTVSLGVGLASLVLAWTLPVNLAFLAGPFYAIQGPLHWWNGAAIAKHRARLFSAGGDAR